MISNIENSSKRPQLEKYSLLPIEVYKIFNGLADLSVEDYFDWI